MSVISKQEVTDIIYKASLYLDECRWSDWLDLCDGNFHYSIQAFSPEINKNMIYLDGNFEQMKSMTEMLPKHNTDNSPLSRHTVVYTVDVNEKEKIAKAVSSFAVYQTQLDGINSHVLAGESNLFMVGKYRDKFSLNDDGPLFLERNTHLDTRRLDKGSHWPI
jgi:methanesulfonate monooxygenase subunit beta